MFFGVCIVDPPVPDGTMLVVTHRSEHNYSNRQSPLEEEIKMNVLTLMVIIILAYWAIAMISISMQKDWE